MKTRFPARFAALLGLLLLPALALAATPDVPAPNCKQPTPPPKKGASAPQVVAYNKALPEYRKCIQAYVGARTTDAKKYSKLAQANSEAANKAVKEFNAFVKKVSSND
ncbi:MAG: hypothetical protein L0H29_05840 [Sinobacteraceae bacterium]|nr:hypothetical protein [Nevskiaceae bacterium]